ncbi:hypothetical protein [Larkinella soli]|uniref:hypothetical protein n=1 Tax=Larkinella soli TaxID=1770527 RepID=UPI000FFB1F44|nr:hypothetical protein [Larkinella soli]
MNLILIYLYWGQYKMLRCSSGNEGMEILNDLAVHEDIDPVGVFNPRQNQMSWHPSNPFRQVQEHDKLLKRALNRAQLRLHRLPS